MTPIPPNEGPMVDAIREGSNALNQTIARAFQNHIRPSFDSFEDALGRIENVAEGLTRATEKMGAAQEQLARDTDRVQGGMLCATRVIAFATVVQLLVLAAQVFWLRSS